MSVITIVGAGMMGSAIAFPASDNSHEVRLVGTHLDRDIIENVQVNGFHPTLKRRLPAGIKPYHIEELGTAVNGADLIIGGISSFGVDWFTEKVLPVVPDSIPVLLVTKGLHDEPDGRLVPFPHLMKEKLPPGRNLFINAIGGPCTSYELADRRNSSVVFCGEDPEILKGLKGLLETSYYHINTSTDVIGVESAVALKNAYALAVTLAVGLIEREEGIGCQQAYNPQAALFGQSIREMSNIIELVGGGHENIVYGAGDLYVTIFGGRTRKLGTLLGRGLSFDEAMAKLEGITLESVVITTRIARALYRLEKAGLVNMKDFPLLVHINDIINNRALVEIPWKEFQSQAL
ncbi:MAG: glycerol-3-phosphate dehydrogenase [Clostridiales bacterium]|nr:glycerol-3-phosphate dehydrogenase [Clostridiales bacterium]